MDSNVNYELVEVNIDFEDASTEWKKNKKYIGNGSYKYICTHKTQHQNKNVCGRICYKKTEYCWIHRNVSTMQLAT